MMFNTTSLKAKAPVAAVGAKGRNVSAKAGKYDEELMQTAVRLHAEAAWCRANRESSKRDRPVAPACRRPPARI